MREGEDRCAGDESSERSGDQHKEKESVRGLGKWKKVSSFRWKVKNQSQIQWKLWRFTKNEGVRNNVNRESEWR